MKVRKRFNRRGYSVHPKAFAFIDKRTGAQRFEVKADAHGKMPTDEAVSLLAVHCLMRNQMPSDFRVVVSTGENLLDSLTASARKLIHACRAIQTSIHLTTRQQEVLHGIHQGLSNKDIGKKLNVTERTAKFHVAALFEKFNVVGRMGLMRKANELFSGVRAPAGNGATYPGKVDEYPTSHKLRPSEDKIVRMMAVERRSRG